MKKMTHVFAATIFLNLLFSALLAPTVEGRVNILGLDEHAYYDIYIGSDEDGVSIIKNVRIDGFQEVGGVTFMVIRTDFFESDRSKGLVMFAYVRAILPAHKVVHVQGTQKVHYQHNP